MLIAIAVAVAWVAPVSAQTAVRRATPLLATPGGRELATIRAGTPVRAATVRQGFTQVTLDGYIDASLVGASRDSFPNTVRASGGARLREAGRSAAAIIAELRDGMGLTPISRAGGWIRIRRTGWVATSALGPAREPAPPSNRGGRGSRGAPPRDPPPRDPPPASPPAATPPVAQTSASTAQQSAPPPQTTSPLGGALSPAGPAILRASPAGDTIARLDSGAVLVPLARESGWTRVRIEGWVRDGEVVPADPALRVTLSAADIRAAPDRARGAMVRWDVEFIALQRADALRPDMRLDERYILARGPGNESALLYIVVPPALIAQAEGLESLDRLTIVARVRVGRSEPVGVPILDLVSLTRR
jgi:hypothetical protein